MSDFTQAAKDFANMLEQARVLDSLELQSTALERAHDVAVLLTSTR